jgi:hypothetical protein
MGDNENSPTGKNGRQRVPECTKMKKENPSDLRNRLMADGCSRKLEVLTGRRVPRAAGGACFASSYLLLAS